MSTKDGTPPNHDTLTCYTDYRCRLPECVARYNQYNQGRRQAQRAGTWNALVDAEPVRRHILHLKYGGLSNGEIAASAGLPIQSVIDFISSNRSRHQGRRHRTSPDVAAKILAITPVNATLRRLDSTGTIRRIQALTAIGWPQTTIATRATISPANMCDLARRTFVFASTAAAVNTAYETLRHLRPERNGVPKIQAKKARNRAAAKRWPTPTYWDQRPDCIDDPDFTPEYGISRVEQIANEALWLITGGVSTQDAAERLGVTRGYVEKSLQQHRRQGLAA